MDSPQQPLQSGTETERALSCTTLIVALYMAQTSICQLKGTAHVMEQGSNDASTDRYPFKDVSAG
jgi:hypothetical protein